MSSENMPVDPPVSLPLMESFLTIQGEGFHTGKAAFFVRLGGCDVGCVWCDVKDSWNAKDHPMVTATQIAELAKDSGAEIVVITGGEPLMYDLTRLTKEIKAHGMKTHLETSGAYSLSGSWDWVCFSPKKFKEPRKEFYSNADELKVIVYHRSDFEWAEGHSNQLEGATELFFQPEWSKKEEMIPLIVEYVRSNPKWRISLQTHKYLNIP